MSRPNLPLSACANRGRILIVDDTIMQRRVLAAIVEGLGYQAVSVENGEAAIAMCLTGPFDAVLMDIHMPGMGGLEATRLIRTFERGTMPIIGVTSDNSVDVQRMARRAGMDVCLEKPARPAEIANALHDTLVARDVERAAS